MIVNDDLGEDAVAFTLVQELSASIGSKKAFLSL